MADEERSSSSSLEERRNSESVHQHDVKKIFTLATIEIMRKSNEFEAEILSVQESDEEDEEQNLVHLNMLLGVQEQPSRIQNYVEKTVSGYTDREFQSHFRVRIEVYEMLETKMGAALSAKIKHVQVRTQLLSVLWLLATPDSYRSVAERFDLSKSILHECFISVVTELNKMASAIVKWPSFQEKSSIKEAFFNSGKMPDCIGAVDGTFIEIKAPNQHPHVYICRKAFHAVQLQVIALPDLSFSDAFTGYPGSVGDRRVFINSPIYKKVEAHKDQYFSSTEYILGDKAYPVLTWCVPPYINRGRMTEVQTQFNKVHAQTRQVVERSFALLFGRYRRLKFLDMTNTKFIPATILAACVLHNLCLNGDDLLLRQEAIIDGEAFMLGQQARLGAEREEAGGPSRASEGYQFRDNLANSLV